jgi:hypothetical protein
MDMHLVVVKPFGGFVRGDIITDPTKIAQVMTGEHAHAVVRVQPSPGKED